MTDKYFDDARAMFMTEGWHTFQKELDEAISICTLDKILIRTKARFTTRAPIAQTWMRHGCEVMCILASALHFRPNVEAE